MKNLDPKNSKKNLSEETPPGSHTRASRKSHNFLHESPKMKNSDQKIAKKFYPRRPHRTATHVQVASHTIFRVKNTHFMATGIKPATSHPTCYSFNYSTPYSLCPYEIFSLFYYTHLILKWVFGTLNDLKWKYFQLQRCITFRYLQLSFWLFLNPRLF